MYTILDNSSGLGIETTPTILRLPRQQLFINNGRGGGGGEGGEYAAQLPNFT